VSSQAFEALRTSFEGYETSFADRDELERYRATVLEKTEHQARFIAARVDGGAAVEVACGNGRLLVSLAKLGAIDAGLGIDLAESRIEFAREWAADTGLGGLEFLAADVLDAPVESRFDLALCITGSFGYFDAYAPGSAQALLERLHGAVVPGGLLLFEQYQRTESLRLLDAAGDRLRTWYELPESDPWRFYLSETWREGEVLVHNKTFIGREDGRVDSRRSERMVVYPPARLEQMLSAAGFTDVRLFEGWTEAAYAGGETMVVTARRM